VWGFLVWGLPKEDQANHDFKKCGNTYVAMWLYYSGEESSAALVLKCGDK